MSKSNPQGFTIDDRGPEGRFAIIDLDGIEYSFADEKRSSLEMREPTVKDQRASSAKSKDDEEKELFLLSVLCGVPADDIEGLTLRHYKRLQQAFLAFIS